METKLNPFRNRLVLKLLFMVALVLMLLIPMSWVKNLIYERQYLQEEVQQDIATAWGEAQQISNTDTERYLWEDAVLIMGISDPATITEKVEASWGGDSVQAAPGTRHSEILKPAFTPFSIP